MKSDVMRDLMGVLFEFGRVMRRQMSASFSGVNVLHIHTLAFLEEREGITMKELAHLLHITSPSATALVQKLVECEWVERFRDANNRKLVRLRLTNEGRTHVHAKIKEKNAQLVELLSRIPEEDQREMLRIMRTIIQTATVD